MYLSAWKVWSSSLPSERGSCTDTQPCRLLLRSCIICPARPFAVSCLSHCRLLLCILWHLWHLLCILSWRLNQESVRITLKNINSCWCLILGFTIYSLYSFLKYNFSAGEQTFCLPIELVLFILSSFSASYKNWIKMTALFLMFQGSWSIHSWMKL